MSELFSKREDCYLLAKKLKKQLKDKIDFYGSINIATPNGIYLSSYRRNNGEYLSYRGNCLPFYIKHSKDGFLRISVGSFSNNNSLGEKLAALSDFYEILSEEFGEPDVFYTIKYDDEGLLSLQWSFINKEEEIEQFKNGTYFDDAEIDSLIILGEKKDDSKEFRLNDKTRYIISKRVGLPFELLNLVDEDIENYIKHKNGKEITIPVGTYTDGYPLTSFERKLKI